MRTHPNHDATGQLVSIEIENAYIGPWRAARVLRGVEGVTDVRVRRLFGPEPDVHVTFSFRGCRCMVWEPFGDNSRYWVGADAPEDGVVDVAPIEQAFRQYRVPVLVQLLGDLVSLRVPFLHPA